MNQSYRKNLNWVQPQYALLGNFERERERDSNLLAMLIITAHAELHTVIYISVEIMLSKYHFNYNCKMVKIFQLYVSYTQCIIITTHRLINVKF